MLPTRFIVALSALALAAGPAFAQPTPTRPPVQPRHVTHPAPPHKMPRMSGGNPDHSADELNAKELASIQHGQPAAAPAPMATPTAPARTP
jgi:hypothetical protein